VLNALNLLNCRDECTGDDLHSGYKGLDFATDVSPVHHSLFGSNFSFTRHFGIPK
jgi:hypothetical protein